MNILIKKINSVTSEGISFTLTNPASLGSLGKGMSVTEWYVSWDKIGKSLFGDQYSDAITVAELNMERKKRR